MQKARVYTRTGDQGSSQLLSVGRVPKSHARLHAYGDSDELNSVLGVALAAGLAVPLATQLRVIQADIFVLGSQIAVPHPEKIKYPIPELTPAHTQQLERWIDALDAQLAPLKNFILPGGGTGAALLHQARTICRRCERHVQAIAQTEDLPAPVLTYLNRLSDYLFIAARYSNLKAGVEDVPWVPAK